MHNYNIANRYNTTTRVGNWYEEKELDNHDFKEYLYQKEANNNLTLNTTTKIGFSNQQVSSPLFSSHSPRRKEATSLTSEMSCSWKATTLREYSLTISTKPSLARKPTQLLLRCRNNQHSGMLLRLKQRPNHPRMFALATRSESQPLSTAGRYASSYAALSPKLASQSHAQLQVQQEPRGVSDCRPQL